ncbi:MAG: ABC transporter substrate-binding protein [Castellaniella sp.]|uniref:ABC transporter substrate-binding protein n=1 Tax=Castellaniella sp. TaxID=1955812 RepID=UPI003C73404A
MKIKQTAAIVAGMLALAAGPGVARAQAKDQPVRIGAIADLSGAYSGLAGPGIGVAMEMAVEDFGGKVLGRPIEVLIADSLLKVDVATSRAREWIDQQDVQMILESSDSASALALQKLTREKKRVSVFTSGATALINDQCSPYGMQWAWNIYALANVTGKALTQGGGKSWYFISADYAFGKALQEETAKVVEQAGGKVVGSVSHPFKATDFASFLLSAQSANPDVIALANAGQDTQNAVRQAREFGLTTGKTKVAPLILFDSDVKGMGLDLAQGLLFTTAFYWDRTPESRTWSERFYERRKLMPTMNQAGAYSATMHYLKAVAAAGTLEADAVMEQMRKIPVNDFFTSNGQVRKDGMMVHDMYLAQVKTPAESKGPWDMLTIRDTISGDEAFPKLSDSTCPLVKG